MINILECELTYLKQWLGARHLHLLRFVEEETEKPATAPDSESALRPQPSVHWARLKQTHCSRQCCAAINNIYSPTSGKEGINKRKNICVLTQNSAKTCINCNFLFLYSAGLRIMWSAKEWSSVIVSCFLLFAGCCLDDLYSVKVIFSTLELLQRSD